MTCKTHPDAPHGFVRDASHSEDRYVCECEFWEEPKMNERIRQILNEATVGLEPDLSTPTTITLNELSKFAELLIGECIDRITTYDLVPGHSAKWEDIYDIHARLLQDLGEDLKEHFGIKE